ncbi:MAG: NAD(P)H-dependent oxidoreductase [Gulosibacter sp.]|uniref:NAD(P)H-dependent oxidoreductase n=1 Tax=Gulosibacter sp. TaxID=2817531 RepID=UPI003F913C14
MTHTASSRTLLVVSHPVRGSHTWRVAETLQELLEASGGVVEIADLHAEGFDPTITAEDLLHYAGEAPVPKGIRREHERLERQDAVIMVAPMYWWNVPALLKGWIDRVFTNGWAFGHGQAADSKAQLPFARGGFVLLTSGSVADLDRHGYNASIATLLPYGVLSYCGRPEAPLLYLEESEAELTPEKANHWRASLTGFLSALGVGTEISLTQ